MSRTIMKIEFDKSDHAHVCLEHAKQLEGKTDDKFNYYLKEE